MKNIMGIIVTYNPDIELLNSNILSVINQLSCIYLVDNASANIDALIDLCLKLDINLIKFDKNYGVAYALNQGLMIAENENFDYVLTLDQDSISPANLVHELKKSFDLNSKFAIIGPQIYDINKNDKIKLFNETVYVNQIITSGNLVDVKKALLIGGFNNELFIDCVDFDICWNLKKNGFLIGKNMNVFLQHAIGNRSKKRVLFHDIYVLNHNSQRVYYMTRNKIYLLRKYWKMSYVKKYAELFALIRRTMWVILFEREKFSKIKSTLKGFLDGFKLKIK